MTILPSEINRCRPASPTPRCANCRRWADHPDQPVGSIARVVNTTSDKDPACVYIPVSLLEVSA